jgi:branched-chain amino acid transport system permease protein
VGDGVTLIQVVVSGLLLGGIYTLLATGITLIFGVLKVVNFAHGELMMIGMYVTLFLYQFFGIHPYVSIPLAAIVLFLVGAALHAGLVKWTISGKQERQIVLTLGVSILLQSVALMTVGGNFRSAQLPPVLGGSINLWGINIGTTHLVAFLIAIVITFALLLFLNRTLLGKAIRATAMDGYAATLMGVPVQRVYLITMGIGGALAGITGAILMPIYPVYPTVGANLVIIAFIVVVLGGMGSVVGALYGGLIIGVVEAVVGYFAGAEAAQVAVLALFLAILLIRPQGIMKAEAA